MSGVQIPHARLINTKTMEIYTVQEFQERWDEMIERVENGEHIGISDGKNTCVMVPADEELIRIYTDHEEGC
jgi:predicted nuclease with TOPRIM domain